MQSISNKIDLANVRLREVNDQIAKAEQARKSADASAVQSGIAKDSALDAKRDAESKRDKAIAELELAEKRLKARMPEIETQIRELEQRLNAIKAESKNCNGSVGNEDDTNSMNKEGGAE